MAATYDFTPVNGAALSVVGSLISTAQLKTYVITVRSTSNGSNTAVDLRSDDGVYGGNLDLILRELNPMLAYAADGATGVIHVVMDGHSNDATSIASRVEALGFGTDTAVTLGTQITVA
jgi:hypothetical protein